MATISKNVLSFPDGYDEDDAPVRDIKEITFNLRDPTEPEINIVIDYPEIPEAGEEFITVSARNTGVNVVRCLGFKVAPTEPISEDPEDADNFLRQTGKLIVSTESGGGIIGFAPLRGLEIARNFLTNFCKDFPTSKPRSTPVATKEPIGG